MPRLLSAILTLALTLTPLATFAQGATDCRNKVEQELARELRLYRTMLFGKKHAADASLNTVRYDQDGWAWLKANDSDAPWITSDSDNLGLEWSNDQMDGQDEHSDMIPIVGLFATKRVTTSEIIPLLLHSIRTLECRADTICKVVTTSQIQNADDGPQPIPVVRTLGCKEYTDRQTYQQCHFDSENLNALDQTDSATYCREIVNQMMLREGELLKLAVEYDASYRTTLQFAGNFDIFLRELRWPLMTTIRNAASVLGQLGRIPCFTAACDSAPPPTPLPQQ